MNFMSSQFMKEKKLLSKLQKQKLKKNWRKLSKNKPLKSQQETVSKLRPKSTIKMLRQKKSTHMVLEMIYLSSSPMTKEKRCFKKSSLIR